ncbi:MAG: hypothetical protein GTO63_06625 [Anaerolineae bacterium]|nr:hypothetical protein [Anaerolineae bacterium]NIN94647.1 hypothetical protein [Anaerolineae bacterium]NIQ77707.1 hypothetical protein [Anaerolineae bacterium]
MEMEINLQDYVDVILRHWRVVLLVFLSATVVATVLSFVQPSTYEASVTLVEETYEFLDSPRLSALDRTVVKRYPNLARTAAVENRVIAALESSLSAEEKTPGALRRMVTVREDRDNPALFRIIVLADDPDKAVQIANTWAEQYLQTSSDLEAGWSSQLAAIEQNLKSAEEELARFEQESGLGLVADPGGDEALIVLGARGLELETKLLSLAEHKQAHDNIVLLLQRARQAKEAGGAIEDLPLQLLNTPAIIDRGQLSVDFVREQGDLDTFIQLLQAEEGIVSEVVDELATEVQQLQEELVQDKLELQRLTRARDLAEGAYTALTNEVQESQLFQSRTHILSPATRSKSTGSSPLVGIALGAAMGLAGGVLAAFAAQYFEDSRQRA